MSQLVILQLEENLEKNWNVRALDGIWKMFIRNHKCHWITTILEMYVNHIKYLFFSIKRNELDILCKNTSNIFRIAKQSIYKLKTICFKYIVPCYIQIVKGSLVFIFNCEKKLYSVLRFSNIFYVSLINLLLLFV